MPRGNTPRRRCLECGAPLEGGVQQRFCNGTHQKRYKRRQLRMATAAEVEKYGATPSDGAADGHAHTSDIAKLVGTRREEIIRETFIEELRPVVREAIDEEAVRAIKGMVGLAPTAVLVLEQDLQSDDPMTRSKAAALVIKYTLGNPNVTPPREGSMSGVTIINNLPDAGGPINHTPVEEDALIDGEAVELRRCDTCNLDKPLEDFPGDGPRCATCLADRKAQVLETFNVDLSDAPSAPEPTDEKSTGLDQTRYAHTPELPEGSRPAWEQVVGGAAFAGPPDPNRWSPGKG